MSLKRNQKGQEYLEKKKEKVLKHNKIPKATI